MTDKKRPQRLDAVDALRGVAIVLMAAYHFCFDLNYFGAIHANFYEAPFWLTARTVILSTFLALVGASQVLAARAGRRTYWRRIGALAGCAALVSIGTFVIFGPRWIFFGVLHFILLASLIGPFFLRWHQANLLLGIGLLGIGATVALPLFDQPALQWIGLMTFKPLTEDYVPLLPWFGVVLLGMFAAQVALKASPPWLRWHAHSGAARALAFAGRHSLLIYMLHQPLLMGLLYAWFALMR